MCSDGSDNLFKSNVVPKATVVALQCDSKNNCYYSNRVIAHPANKSSSFAPGNMTLYS